MLRSMGQTPVAGNEQDPGDPRVVTLRKAVSRLRRELAAYPAEFPDRGIAEDELAALHAMAASGTPEVLRLRRSLLLVAGSAGSVSALRGSLAQVRRAVELFGELPEE
ncbi:hypothetical protein HUT18_30340 [Streptomyces sp. NA04227]|uniref:DUF5955 family protein n=1 Tax=Streptomyces sp. NA04227 TaxID=2742136 RepID=UPI0015908C95|nr:DUF5955 family protein [Streptomyces sp. NA04227]QKW10080.1 hypothetical protein HUT18_30340 [Streptomyces sp. NA04227]